MSADDAAVGQGLIGQGLIGQSVVTADGLAKAAGEWVYGADLAADGLVWAAIVGSPHAYAAIRGIDVSRALQMHGVRAVITHADVPGAGDVGLPDADWPVLARDVVRYVGEPVAAVAADRPDLARQAAAAVDIDYETLTSLTDAEEAIRAADIHPDGNVIRHLVIRHGDFDAPGDVVVEGTYEVGPSELDVADPVAGLALPEPGGGVVLRWPSATPELEREQVARSLGLAADRLRYVPVNLGREQGPRHDAGLQVVVCLLAMHAWRPVKLTLSRAQSSLTRARRHPARMWYRHHADHSGKLARVEARLILDGGAYATTSRSALAAACAVAAGPYAVPSARIEGFAVRTTSPPAGGTRADGLAQGCFAHEAQMDKLAVVLRMDPLQLRLHNALRPGDRLVTGQPVMEPAPVADLLQACADVPLPARHRVDQLTDLPGGHGRTSERAAVRRGVGLAAGFGGVLFTEGAAGEVKATVRLDADTATVRCGHTDHGQGFVTVVNQVVRELLGAKVVVVEQGVAGEWASGPQWLSGRGLLALEAVAVACQDAAKRRADSAELPGAVEGLAVVPLPPTTELDIDGQGAACVGLAFAVHRAVVDVDAELGLVRVVDVTTAQHTGRVLNPLVVRSTIESGVAQGVRLAVPAEPADGGAAVKVRIAALLEDAGSPLAFGAASVGDAPVVSSAAAVAAALRDAAGVAVVRLPVRPGDLI